MPAPLFVIPPALKVLISTVVGAKIVGFALGVVTAPTTAATRNAILEHTRHVLQGLDAAEIGVAQTDRVSLHEDLQILERGVQIGWHQDYETAAFGRLMYFLSCAHAKSTAHGVSELASAHATSAGKSIWKAGENIFESIFPKKS